MMSTSLKKNLLRSTGLRPKRTKSKPLAPLRSVEKVEQSWSIVSSDLESLGVDFFTRVFLDVPAALDLFLNTLLMTEDEMSKIKESHVAIIHFVKENKLIKAHARLVIREVGRCVAGLYDMTVLVPRLRSLGRMHGAAGVKPEHFSIFFKHLMETVKDRITSTNSNAWDVATEEAWVTVKTCMERILSKPELAVGSLDGGGTLNRWGVICGGASLYACIITPLRVAGIIGYGNTVGASFSFWDWVFSFHKLGFYESLHNYGFALLDAFVVTIFVVELLLGNVLLRLVKVKDLREVKNISTRKFQRSTLFGKAIIVLRWLGIHESVTFPISNVIFILSYLLQYHNMIFGQVGVGGESGESLSGFDSSSSQDNIVGVHWTWSFGVLRLIAVFRALYAMRRMELTYTINNRADNFTRLTLRTTRLILGLAYTSHVAACLYILVARIELGPRAYYDAELATPFFPDYTILGKENGMLTNYLRCVHFAFTNLAGMGNHDSTPYSALECIFTLAVNALGATLYAFTTGLLLSMIEPAAERANQFGDKAAALAEFMIEVGMSLDDQDRIIQGFILLEMSGGAGVRPSSLGRDDNSGPFAPAPGKNCTAPAYPERLVHNLPRYLQDELHTVALVDAMKRRERCFRRCSNEFLTALASSLKQSITLLPGDYIVREGDNVPTQLLIVEQGCLEVVVEGNYIRTFERGDMISFHWAESMTRRSFVLTSARHHPSDGSSSFSPLFLSESTAGASVRSMDHCKIATGLSSKSEKKELKKRYPSDWRELEEVLDNARGQRSPKPIIKEGNDAPIVVHNNVHDVSNNGTIIDASIRSRKSITQRVRRLTHHYHAPSSGH